MATPTTAKHTDFDPYPHINDAQHDLYDRMSEISEEGLCAGWIHDNEYNIWAAITRGEPAPAYRPINPRLLRRCQKLADETAGWIVWDDGPQFVPMEQWLAMFAKYRSDHQAPQLRNVL